MTNILIYIPFIIIICLLVFILYRQKTSDNDSIIQQFGFIEKSISRLESGINDNFRATREEINRTLVSTITDISNVQNQRLDALTKSNVEALDKMRVRIDDQLTKLIERAEVNAKESRESLVNSLKEFNQSFTQNVKDFNEMQRTKFNELVLKQEEMVKVTELKLEKMRETVDEKLQKTLEARLGQSFELVSKQLESVQKGLGEMQNLANDVGGLKKVLSNVKTRGTFGEIQLGSILEQILIKEQYDTNVKTKKGSSDLVEFAIKLPGKDENNSAVYLPVDAKFPQESFHALQDAYEAGDTARIESETKALSNTIKKCAKDIHDKYIDPPYTTDFGIMFLPSEGLYAEVIRRTDLVEQLQRDYKIVVTGPTTLAAILNSLQMGFKTLAIQKRSGEVWEVLKAVKTEFGEFGKVLSKAQEKITSASSEIDKLVGVRTRQINRKLDSVETLSLDQARQMLDTGKEDESEELDNTEPESNL